MRVCAIIALFVMTKTSGYNLATLGNLFYELNQKYAKVQKDLKILKNTTYSLSRRLKKLEKNNTKSGDGKIYLERFKNMEDEIASLKITVDELSKSVTEIREEMETLKSLLKNQKTTSQVMPTGKGIVIGMAIMTFIFLIVLAKRSQKEKEEKEKLESMKELVRSLTQDVERLLKREEDDPLKEKFEEIERKLQTVSEINRRQKIAEVFYLRDKGFTTQEIAKRLGVGKGEVELILSLGKKKNR